MRLLSATAILLTCAAAAAAQPVVINDKVLFPEGPVVVDGKLLFAEYSGHVVTVQDGGSSGTLWKQDGCGPSAVVPVKSGYAITCYDSGQLVIISPAGETLKVYDKDSTGTPLLGPNDGGPDGQGGAYFTLSGPWESGPIVGRIVYMTADGTLAPVADDLHYANGIARGHDGRLYVNESEAGRVISFAIAPDGSLSDRRLFVRLYQLGEATDTYPDGIKLGPNGNFYVGHYNAGLITEIAPDGSVKNTYEFPSPAAPNLAFSADGKTMFVAAVDNKDGAPYQGRIYSVQVK